MVASRVISMDKKHIWSWQYSQKYCHNLCHFDVFIIIFRHTAWLENSEAVALRASLKNLVKFTRKYLFRDLFFNRVTGWKPATSSNKESGTGVFLWVLRRPYEKFLRRPFLSTSENGCFWRAKSFAGFSFRNTSGFYYKRTGNCFTMNVLHHIFPLKFLKV